MCRRLRNHNRIPGRRHKSRLRSRRYRRKRDRPSDTGKRGNQRSGCGVFPDESGGIQDSTYTLLPEYDNTKIDLNTLTTAEQLEEAAKTLAETAKQEQGKKTDGNGQVVFEKQELGVYLLTTKDQPGVRSGIPDPLKHPYHGNRRNLTLRHQSGTEAHPETSRAYGTPDRTV